METTRIFDLLHKQKINNPRPDCLSYKLDGKWKSFSTNEVIDIVNGISLGLIKNGIVAGDKVAIISMNRPEWNFLDFAIQQIGAVSVPMYPTITVDDYSCLLYTSDAADD